jgi:deoxyribonuclease IV
MSTDPQNQPLGAHMSIAGGLHLAVERIMSLEGTAMQIFTKNHRQWNARPLSRQEIDLFKNGCEIWGGHPIGAHDTYLINLAAPDPTIREKSIAAFADELERCEALSVPFLITHPGSSLEDGKDRGLETFVASMDKAIENSRTEAALILLENTAGQGTNLGADFEQLAWIIGASRHPARLGVCFDTCHAFGAGYELRTEQGYAETFERFDGTIGLSRLKFFHLNDTKNVLGSRKDRHEHIGQGHLGLEPFRMLLNDPRFVSIPKVLETPKEKDMAEDRENLRVLRSLIMGAR